MAIPSSTYRVQLHQQYTFKNLRSIINYLRTLGVSTIYAAPIMQSVPSSMHGYDSINPCRINPEIGTLDELRELSATIKQQEMTWLQDIVPNHMAFTPSNIRLADVMERGKHSDYYNYFDINWNHSSPELHGKLMVPFLGDELTACLARNEIKVSFSDLGFTIDYFDTQYPMSISGYECMFDFLNKRGEDIQNVWNAYIQAAVTKKHKEWLMFKIEWIKSFKETYSTEIRDDMMRINNDRNKLQRLLNSQYYWLSYWKRTETQINYRRFFTVNSLICLHMEDEAVFEDYHKLLLRLHDENIIQGFRIDHIDGLYDPASYMGSLRKRVGNECYVIAEKILEQGEAIPKEWPLHGTSGYEFLSFVNQLFTDKKGAKLLVQFYRELVPEMPLYNNLAHEKKKMILENHMAGEWDNLIDYFFELKLQRDFDRERLKYALALIMIFLPVYRLYLDQFPLQGKDLHVLNETVEKAKASEGKYGIELDYLQSLLVKIPENDSDYNKIIMFFKRVMQFTGPLTAKGIEDTTFYIYNPLISHDEVGDSPSTLGISIQQFHKKMLDRQRLTPLSLNATATHDTKRGEDARVRLNVLSEMPEEWIAQVTKWIVLNERHHTMVDGIRAPNINDEYFIYQSIVGGFPEDFVVTEEFVQRVQAYMVKAMREAKINSNWQSPNSEYEDACLLFIKNILLRDSEFLNTAIPFIKNICQYSNIYSIAQTLIKITAPGIPDIYQGCELWDLSYVDPDNRRPVDYISRTMYLQQIGEKEKEGTSSLFKFLSLHRSMGLEKLYVTWKILNFRRENAELFTKGEYLPVQVPFKETTAVAFMRHLNDQWILIAVPLGLVKKKNDGVEWDDIKIDLPLHAPGHWKNIFTHQQFSRDELTLKNFFDFFPVAMLTCNLPT